MLQTSGQRSSTPGAAESKRQAAALESYFPERICYMFLIPKCRGDWDPGGCTCEKRNAAQCQISIFSAGKTRYISEVVIVQRLSFRKYPKSAPT